MGKYMEPADVVKVGRFVRASTYDAAKSDLRSGEQLFGVYNRGLFKVAPLLDSAAEWDHFESNYNAGHFLDRAFYAVKGGD